MKIPRYKLPLTYGEPRHHPLLDLHAQAIRLTVDAKDLEMKTVYSIRAVLNCDETKARKVIKICVHHNCNPRNVVDLLVMGWTFRQSIKLASNGVTARICHVLNKWPNRIKPTE